MRFKGIKGSSISLSDLAHTLVEEHGCLLLPGQYFPSSTQNIYNDHFRFGFGRKNFPECLSQLEIALDKIICGIIA